MDTPQVTPALLHAALRALYRGRGDAVLGPCLDGGWWGVGLHAPDPAVFLGVPMSTTGTYDAQCARLYALGLHTRPLPVLRDVDDIHDAVAVARDVPDSRFAVTLRHVQERHLTLVAR